MRSETRFVWTARHDRTLVDSVLALGDMLKDPVRSYPRTKFWAAVSDDLHVTARLPRNSRQCRDRFNLLFSRALLAEGPSSDPALDAKLARCAARFRFGNGRSLELKSSAAPSAPLPPSAPSIQPPAPRTCAVHELIHPPEATAASQQSQGTTVPAPDVALINNHLCEVRRMLDSLTNEILTVQRQVQHLQHSFDQLQRGLPTTNSTTATDPTTADTP